MLVAMPDKQVREELAEAFEAIYEEMPVSLVHAALANQIVAGLSRLGFGISGVQLDYDGGLLDLMVAKSEPEILGNPETDEALLDDEALPDEDEFTDDDEVELANIIIDKGTVEVLLHRIFSVDTISIADPECIEKVCRLVVAGE